MSSIDLKESLRQEVIRVSDEMGFKISAKNDLDKTLLDYLTVRFKLIDARPRSVRFQKDLMADIITNEHPKSDEIKRIANIARVGGNLNHFQSKKIIQANFHDHLVNEWNIHHLHLSFKEDKKSGFVKQGNIILFVYVNEKEIIFLGTDKHNDDVFGNRKWLKILHDEFPEIMNEFKVKGEITDIYPKVNSKERQDIWNSGITMGMTEIDGTIYHGLGLGHASSGHSVEAVMKNNDILRWIMPLEKQLIESHELVCDIFNISKDTARFEIKFRDKIMLIETTNNLQILEYPNLLMTKEELKALVDGNE